MQNTVAGLIVIFRLLNAMPNKEEIYQTAILSETKNQAHKN